MGFSEDFKRGIRSDLGKHVIAMDHDGLSTDVKKFISTGSTLLDYSLANRKDGGVPVGKITEIFGLNSTGKTLICMQICANAQKEGALVVYIDPEWALNSDFAMRVGLDTKHENFIHMHPNTMEDVFTAMFKLFHKLDEAEKNKTMHFPYVVLVWDSIPAAPPKEDVDAENPNPTSNIGLIPRVLSKNLKMLLATSGRKNVAQIFINQVRSRIGAMPGQSPWVTTGGNALPFYASCRIFLKNKGKIKTKKTKEVVGINVLAEVVKTRFGPPYRRAEFQVYFNKGVDDTLSLISYLKDRDLIKSRKGGRYGTLFYIPEDEKDDGKRDSNPALSELNFKKKILTDKDFRERILKIVDHNMVKSLVDPDKELLELDTEDNS